MIDWTGRRDAGVVLAPEGRLGEIETALLERGTRATDEAWEAIRVSLGVPRFGVDYDEETLPQEASMERLAVSFTKGCYLGQETVFRLEKRGHPRRRLAHLVIDGSEPLAAGTPLVGAEGEVGTVSSVAVAPTGQELVAIGPLKHKLATAGTTLTALGRGVRVLGPAGEKAAKSTSS
jgi:folate-binding protein YgfZ